MKKHTETTRKERLRKAIDALTEENQQHILGILQALAFAQTTQGTTGTRAEDSPNIRAEPA
jgi:hypothetical protein